ncbi:calcium-binding protein [Tistrella arctica]|uniref:calcium-binding protein n=1 Tax=Tistrella arctica TaxID=3133430 RepID=UPI0031F6C2F6
MATFTGGAGDDSLTGTDEDDVMRGRGGADRIDGRAGRDTASYTDSAAGVVVDLRSGNGSGGDAEGDRLTGIEIVHGSNFADQLAGGAAADTLRGFDGDDVLRGRGGADLLEGGAGRDTASYTDSAAGVVVDLRSGNGSGGDAEGDRLTGIEIVHGSSHGDQLTGSGADDVLRGFDGDDILEGGGGADLIEGGAGNDTASYASAGSAVRIDLLNGTKTGTDASGDRFSGIESLTGSAYDDGLQGDNGANSLTGGAGDDRLVGRGGDDILDGGSGTDIADYSDHGHAVIGGRSGITDRVTGELDLLTSIEIVIGSDFNDLIWNNGFDGSFRVLDRISGGGGDDFLLDGVDAGADTVENGPTTFDGGAGNDWVQYYAASGSLTINLATGLGSGNIAAGDRYIDIENIIVSPRLVTATIDGVTVTTPRTTDDILTGTDGANQLDGGGGGDDIRGGDGDDYLIGRMGGSSLDGGNGLDTIDYHSDNPAGSALPVDVDLALGRGLGGSAEGDTYLSIEAVVGTRRADRITGDAADNYLTGGLGADRLDGGDGTDTAVYGAGRVQVDLNLGTGRFGEAEGDRLFNIENLIAAGGDDALLGNDGANLLDGRQGDDLLAGRGGDDVLVGGTGADRMHGGDGSDTVSYSLSGAAVQIDLASATTAGGDAAGDQLTAIENLIGSAFDDSLTGDTAANVLSGGTGDDRLTGGAGNDVLIGGTGADRIDGGVGNDTVFYGDSDAAVSIDLRTAAASGGDAAGDILIGIEGAGGSAFADLLIGDAGDNTLLGNGGDDIISGGDGADYIDGGAGRDTMRYTDDTRDLDINLDSGLGRGGSAANDRLISIEVIESGSGDDLIQGQSNETAERFMGGGGDDQLNGRGGTDMLSGGSGADRFLYAATIYSRVGRGDHILDFSQEDGDRLDLSGIDTNPATIADDGFSFIDGSGFSGTTAEIRVQSAAGRLVVLGDANGDGAADIEINLIGFTGTLTAADFIL